MDPKILFITVLAPKKMSLPVTEWKARGLCGRGRLLGNSLVEIEASHVLKIV